MRGANQHLSGEEIEQLTGSATDVEVGALEGAMDHLERCELCRFRMLSVRDLSGEPPQGAGGARAGNSPCPPEARWLEVAAGLGTAAERKRYIEHAAGCARCGQLLKEAMEDVGMALTEEEKTKVAALASAQPDWQKQVAQKIAASASAEAPVSQRPDSSSKKFVFWPRWAAAFAAFIVAAGGGWWAWVLLRAPSVETLIAQAYTEKRTMEMRIPGAKYAPMHVERGSSGSNLNKPTALLKAEALISEGLQKNPNDPAWLQARARADLLDGNYNSAVKSLQRALEARPDAPELLTDLGLAYFQEADYGNAVESLGKALATSPKEPVILFNHALACERIFLYAQAIDDWEHYLAVDPNSEWAKEARQHLSSVQKKQEEHDRSEAEPLLNPAVLAQSDYKVSITRAVDQRIEEYLRLVVREWLPRVFPTREEQGTDANLKDAVEFIARLTANNHADRWLADLIAGSPGNFPEAIASLSRAAKANDAGNYATAEMESLNAERLFAMSQNLAGVLRARFERIFALHLSHQGSACLRAVSRTAGQMETNPYSWLQIQYHLEESSCHALMGDLGGAQRIVMNTLKEANDKKYGSSYLRAIGFASEDFAEARNLKDAWAYGRIGLETFWSGTYVRMMGYNLYTDLDTAAEIARQPHLQVAIWRQALAILAADKDLLLCAMAHTSAGNAAFAAGANDSAEKEFEEASRLFDALPQTEAVRNDRIEAETWLAYWEAQRGRETQALSRLERIQSEIAFLSNNYVAIKFYATLGALKLDQIANADAGRALRSAIALAELTLRTLKSERDRLMWNREASEPYREMVKWRLLQGDAQGALEIWQWYRGAVFRDDTSQTASASLSPKALAEGPSLPDLTEVANSLSRLTDTTVLSYAMLSDRPVVWKYDDRGISVAWVAASTAEVQREAERFRQLCADPRSDLVDLRHNAQSLYNLLIAPIEKELQSGRTLMIEADGSLAGVPMEALVDSRDHYLGELYPVVSSFGFYYQARLRNAVQFSPDTSAFVVGMSSSGMSGEPLAHLDDALYEARLVADNFRDVHVLEDSQATVGAVRRQLADAQIFHFAGHATPSIAQTGLLLADGLLEPTVVRPGQLNKLQLAVFSACETGRGTEGQYDDVDSLAHVFIDAGVPHILASHWRVDSAATLTFMTTFYRALLSGETVSESLRSAQQDLRAQRGTAHPYYWSAFGAFGTK